MPNPPTFNALNTSEVSRLAEEYLTLHAELQKNPLIQRQYRFVQNLLMIIQALESQNRALYRKCSAEGTTLDIHTNNQERLNATAHAIWRAVENTKLVLTQLENEIHAVPKYPTESLHSSDHGLNLRLAMSNTQFDIILLQLQTAIIAMRARIGRFHHLKHTTVVCHQFFELPPPTISASFYSQSMDPLGGQSYQNGKVGAFLGVCRSLVFDWAESKTQNEIHIPAYAQKIYEFQEHYKQQHVRLSKTWKRLGAHTTPAQLAISITALFNALEENESRCLHLSWMNAKDDCCNHAIGIHHLPQSDLFEVFDPNHGSFVGLSKEMTAWLTRHITRHYPARLSEPVWFFRSEPLPTASTPQTYPGHIQEQLDLHTPTQRHPKCGGR